MGKKIFVPCLDVIMIAFFSEKFTVKDHISNTKLEKGDHYYIQTRHKAQCPEKRSKIQTKCADAPWASYNTL